MKRLLLIRHAKAELINQEITDFERKLSDKGVVDAQKMAEYLLENNIQPDCIISSSANRTLQTARIFANMLKFPLVRIIENSDLYNGYTTSSFLELLAQCSNDNQTIAVVAHNPEIGNLAVNLSENFRGGFPPCTVLLLEFETEQWKDIEVRTGRVMLYKYSL